MSEKPVYGIEWDNLVIDYEQPISEEVLKSMTLTQLFEMIEHMEYIYLYYRCDAYWAEKGNWSQFEENFKKVHLLLISARLTPNHYRKWAEGKLSYANLTYKEHVKRIMEDGEYFAKVVKDGF